MKKLMFVVLLLLSATALRADDVEITIHSGWSFNNADFQISPCIVCAYILPPFNTTTSVDSSISIGIKTAYFLNNRSAIEGSFSVAPIV